MLRCCLPTVRSVGGRGRALLMIRTSSATRLASKLIPEEQSWPFCNTTAHTRGSNETQAGGKDVQDASSMFEDTTQAQAVVARSTRYQGPVQFGRTSPHSSMSRDYVDESPPEDTRSSATTSSDTYALTALKAMLSHDNVGSAEPTVHTANTIRSLYNSIKVRGQLRALTAADFSGLIALLGTLSLSTSEASYRSVHAHPLAAGVSARSKGGDRSYWPLITQLVREKKSQHAQLAPSDHFYAMHARLADLVEVDSDEGARHYSAQQLLKAARLHYDRVRRTSLHPDIHVPYLHALLRRPERGNEALEVLCLLTERLSYSPPSIMYCLWRLALSAAAASDCQAARLLTALRTRSTALTRAVATPSIDTPNPSHDTHQADLEHLILSLTAAISCDTRSRVEGDGLQYLHPWSLQVVSWELSPKSSVDVAWTQLRFLASVNLNSLKPLETLLQKASPPGSWSWRAICVLAVLERLTVGVPPPPQDHYELRALQDAKMQGILTTLWYKWSNAQPGEPSLYLPVRNTIVASFLRVASRIGGSDFLDISWSYLKNSGSLSDRQVAAEYCIAAIRCGYDIRQTLLIIVANVRPALRAGTLSDILAHLVKTDVLLSREVFAVAESCRLPLEAKTVCALANRLASCGQYEDAFAFLRDPRLATLDTLEVLATILRKAPHLPTKQSLERVYAEVARSVLALVRTQPQPHSPSPNLEDSVLAALATHQLPHLPSLIETLQRAWPSFLSHQFVRRFAQELIRQRQFRRAIRLLQGAPPIFAPLHSKIVLQLVRGGANKVASRFTIRPTPRRSLDSTVSEQLLHLVRFQMSKPARIRTLKISSLLLGSSNRTDIALATQLLASAGRIRASQLYRKTEQPQLSGDLTGVGNTILHARVMYGGRRDARQMRKTLELFNRLVGEEGFTPDRVTINILLKAILRWTKAVNAQAVRALFDRMVRSGYPAGGAVSPGDVPFGTDAAGSMQFPVPDLTSPIRYTAHVRPLYKMFIKALYRRRDVEGARTVVGILKELEAGYRLARGEEVFVESRRRRGKV